MILSVCIFAATLISVIQLLLILQYRKKTQEQPSAKEIRIFLRKAIRAMRYAEGKHFYYGNLPEEAINTLCWLESLTKM